MKFNYLFILVILFSIILSVNIAFASDINSTEDILNQEVNLEYSDLSYASDLDQEVNLEQNVQSDVKTDESFIVYVGQNTTDDGGNGSYENPYATLDLACSKVNNEEKITVNIFNGTYYLDNELKFNTKNLVIQGINGEVIVTCHDTQTKKAFELSSDSANFTMNNIIFDASSYNQGIQIRPSMLPSFIPFTEFYFFPFYGGADIGTFNNCTFLSFKKILVSEGNYQESRILGSNEFNSNFIGCIFKNFTSSGIFFKSLDGNNYVNFENCIFSNMAVDCIAEGIVTNKNITLDGLWFGENSIPDYLDFGPYNAITPDNQRDPDYKLPIIKYAIFNATENYLGNGLFEIIGQLTWNGTNDNVGNSFNPMTVILSSETGEIVSEAILENGTFRAIYTSNSSDNKVTAKLDDELITLDFKSVDLNIDAPAINVGDNQNINLTFAQSINNTVNITINNKTYVIKVNDSESVTFTVPEVLKEGTYIVEVLLADVENHVYASNSSELIVSKVSDYTFAPIVPSDAKVGDTVTINVELPSDATGTVTISVGDNNFSADASANVEINITGLAAGDNNIIITYSGDDKYVNKSSESIITAEKVEVDINNETLNVETPNGTVNPEFSIALPQDATGNLTVIVNNKTYTEKLINGSAKITVDDLIPGAYNATVTYTGDGKYDAITTIANLTVPKVDIPITNNTLVTETPEGTTNPEFSINLPSDATGNLTVTVNGKDYTKELVNGSATVSVPDLMPGNYNATITYSGDSKYDPITSNASVSVPKPVLTAKNLSMLYTSGSKYTVIVTVDGKAVSGKTVNFVINGKKTTAKTNKNGYASVKITLPPKTKAYSVSTTYLGVKVTNKVTVKSIVSAKNLKAKKSAKTLKIKVTLKKVNKKYLKGKKVTLKFKGKTYKVKTNKKGVATFTIKKNVLNKLKVGKKYSYKVTYGKDSVNKKITIKK